MVVIQIQMDVVQLCKNFIKASRYFFLKNKKEKKI